MTSAPPGRSPAEGNAVTLDDHARDLADAWRPDPVLTPDQWADEYYFLGTAESAQPGKWSTRAYQREPLQALGAYDPTRRVVLMFPAQTGGKTNIGLIWAGYTASASPCPMLCVQPREIDAEDLSKTRFATMVSLPVMRGIIEDPRSHDSGNTILLKTFPGGSIRFTASNSPAGFRGKPIARLWFDEPDGYPPSAGAEGPPVKLGRARLSSWGPRAKELMTCTPTVTGRSSIEAEYLASSQGEWHCPCPHCGHEQPMVWGGMKWSGVPGESGFACWYECSSCAHRIDERHKTAMVESGRYVHKHPERLGDCWGGHMTAIATPYGGLEWRTLVDEWLYATTEATRGNTMPLRTFVNVRLAETWEDRGESVDLGSLEARREVWEALPQRARVLTAGVDVQDDRLEVEVVAWAAGMESWSVAYYVIPTDPLDAQTWDDLDELLLRTTWPRADGAVMRVRASCVDSGFRSQAVYDYATRRRKARIYAIKGVSTQGAPIWSAKPRRGGRNKDTGTFHTVGTLASCDAVAAYLRVTRPGPGYCHIPSDRAPEWFEGMLAQHRVPVPGRDKRPRFEWRKKAGHLRDEPWDCRRYALAALHARLAEGIKLGDPAPVEDAVDLRPTAPDAIDCAVELATVPIAPPKPAPRPAETSAQGHHPRRKARPRGPWLTDPWG